MKVIQVWVAISIILFSGWAAITACNEASSGPVAKSMSASDAPGASAGGSTDNIVTVDTTRMPKGAFGDAVRYGQALMYNTAYFIGPDGTAGHYLGNKMNCTNCHQNGGTKAYSFNLIASHANYPQYRAREGKVLTLAER